MKRGEILVREQGKGGEDRMRERGGDPGGREGRGVEKVGRGEER